MKSTTSPVRSQSQFAYFPVALLLTRDTQTGEVFRGRKVGDVLVEARRVLLEGVLGTYTRNGRSSYRLMVNSVTDIGEGELLRRFRELRDRLAKLGFFSGDRKRPLPPNPVRIALITSEKGAVIHDFLQNARDRGLGCHIEFYQVKVQGIGAGAEIAEAVQKANADAIRLLNEAMPTDKVLALRSLEALAKVANGKATKIIIPSDLQNLGGVVPSIKELMTDPKDAE